MDAFALRCAEVAGFAVGVGGLRVELGPVRVTGYAGNPGGGALNVVNCPAGWAVTGVSGTSSGSLNNMQVHCGQIGGLGQMVTALAGQPEGNPPYQSICPGGRAAVGFQGRDGLLVDFIQLRCR